MDLQPGVGIVQNLAQENLYQDAASLKIWPVHSTRYPRFWNFAGYPIVPWNFRSKFIFNPCLFHLCFRLKVQQFVLLPFFMYF